MEGGRRMEGSEGSEGEGAGEGGVERLLRTLLDVQRRRATVYSHLHRGFADYLKTSADVRYQELCSEATTSFSECSRQVLDIEAALRDPKLDRPELADILHDVQLQEKQKLHMTATLQVLRRAGRPSERVGEHGHPSRTSHTTARLSSTGQESDPHGDGDAGLEMARLEAEYEAAVKEATGVIQQTVMAINDHIEEVRYEIQDLEQKRGAALEEGF